jgi:hypothetical protein
MLVVIYPLVVLQGLLQVGLIGLLMDHREVEALISVALVVTNLILLLLLVEPPLRLLVVLLLFCWTLVVTHRGRLLLVLQMKPLHQKVQVQVLMLMLLNEAWVFHL